MRELDECLRITRKIAETKEKIEELEALSMSPRNQIISDMPRGGGGTMNAAESYIIRKEKLERQLTLLKEERAEVWKIVTDMQHELNQSKKVESMLWFRFCNGYSWKKCVSKLEEKYPAEEWSANKCFRIYRRFLHKISGDN